MNKLVCLLTLVALAVAPAALHAKIVRTVEKTFAVQPGGNFRASTQGGDIQVTSADVAEVRVTAKQVFRASSEAEADEIAKKLELKLEQQGNDVVVEAKLDRSGWWNNTPVSVSFTVVVPRQFNLHLGTSGGDIAVGDVRGTVKARTSGGNLKFAKIDGALDASTSGGNIALEEGTAQADLSTSGGDIRVKRAGGPTKVSTSGGDIELDSVAQIISASTSGGDIVARLTEPPTKDLSLGTSGGDIKVTVPQASAFRLDASTSGGGVDATGLTITIEKGGAGKGRLVGAVNGGGPLLKLRTSGGSIAIRTH